MIFIYVLREHTYTIYNYDMYHICKILKRIRASMINNFKLYNVFIRMKVSNRTGIRNNYYYYLLFSVLF